MKKYLILLMCFFFIGCSLSANKNKSSLNEVVMIEGMKITATNIHGTIIIEAGKDFERSYTWDDANRTVNLIPRKKRWAGKFGIYSAGDCNWKSHNRIDRGLLEEAQLHRFSIGDALSFLNHHSRKSYTVYRDDGIAVSWRKAIKPSSGPGSVLIVDVWQIYINGEKPKKLPGSQNDKIVVTY